MVSPLRGPAPRPVVFVPVQDMLHDRKTREWCRSSVREMPPAQIFQAWDLDVRSLAHLPSPPLLGHSTPYSPNPEARVALARPSWMGPPKSVRTPSQVIGRAAVGCVGTQGVLSSLQPHLLAVLPLELHAEQCLVLDGSHTLRQATDGMALLRRLRGPRAHAQLIGGEVSSCRHPRRTPKPSSPGGAAGCEPMSMTQLQGAPWSGDP